MAHLKVRSRKGGAAVPLTDDDKALLNLMQGRFPIEPRPYASGARALGRSEDDVLASVPELLDNRIIRDGCVKQAKALSRVVLPTAYPGIEVNTSASSNMIWSQMQLQQWSGSGWESFGGILDASSE